MRKSVVNYPKHILQYTKNLKITLTEDKLDKLDVSIKILPGSQTMGIDSSTYLMPIKVMYIYLGYRKCHEDNRSHAFNNDRNNSIEVQDAYKSYKYKNNM